MARNRILSVLLCLASADLLSAFYLPGVAPRDFQPHDLVEVKAIKLTSVKAQLPYDYYSLPFCDPPHGTVYKTENLGEVLRGDRIVNTPYQVRMTEPIKCAVLCNKTFTESQSKLVAKRIRQQYNVHLLTDNLPCATKISMPQDATLYEHGYKLGYVANEKVYLFNHLKLMLKYHHRQEEGIYRVVGFEVQPKSINFEKSKEVKSGQECPALSKDVKEGVEISEKEATKVVFTYEVTWEPSDVQWTSRWDTYLDMSDVQIHWFSIINSVVVVFFLAGILAMIIVRTLNRDIARYNKIDDEEDTFEETGWKLVHGDVFRPPKHTKMLASLVGSGAQLLCSSFFVIAFAMLGMLSPAARGSLMTAALFIFVFFGMVAGYYAGRLYRTMKGVQWKKAAFQTAMFYPAVMFGVCFILNFFIWGKHSSGAVPFATMLALLCMWMGISVPLIFAGYYFGFRKQPYTHPVRTNQIPRQVPDQMWYLNPFVGMVLAGILPFGAMFIELFFIFTAIWENQFYYLFGFLFLVYLILVISCSQISIVMVYFQLCAEDYHWWWRSFIVSGGSAVYVFAYAVFYFITKLEITEFTPTLLFFGYTLLMVFTFWLVTGTIGFYAAYFFIRRIYGAIKID